MATTFLTKLFGSRNDRLLKEYRKIVAQINNLEPQFEKLSDAELAAQTTLFKERLANGEQLKKLLPEAFAVVREGAKRVMKMRHFDVQMLGGIALHNNKIAEMGTGEGKTLTSTLPIYLNALTGKGVHVVTVNDYLAKRDAEWMGKLYAFLGLSVGINLPELHRQEKQAAYQADITYGTNNEYGFDYLRDNMVYGASERVQRELNYAIVDEVDSILIDEARTPLIISGPAEDSTKVYQAMDAIAPILVRQEGEEDLRTGEGVIKPGDYTVDEKSRQVYLTDQGYETAERILGEKGLLAQDSSLYAPGNIMLVHHLYAALRAHVLFNRDEHYVVQNGEIIIVDEFTGRLMSGRRWSDGLHQAVEAKEGVEVRAENTTMASITFQNYFRLYEKLAGMTGTADTEAYEFQQIYGLETVIIPPNKVSQRNDQHDRIYKTTTEKYKAALEDIQECYDRGQPVLVGTSSIENSEIISELLTKANLPHQVLNAKQHQREADIIAQAGREGMITIATNMAGRGTDIVLGGTVVNEIANIEAEENLDTSEKQLRIDKLRDQWQKDNTRVKELGGLRIIATERHESRRIDNQLRGRSGRQGDLGSSRFYLSLDDSLMRIFAGDRLRSIMERLKIPEGEAIEAGIVTRSIESAQRKVEARNFDIRKQLLDYDDVANDQRKVIYTQRNAILDAQDVTEIITNMREHSFSHLIHQYVPVNSMDEQWQIDVLQDELEKEWGLQLDLKNLVETSQTITSEDIFDTIQSSAKKIYEEKVEKAGREQFNNFERMVLLQTFDTHWRDHLGALDYLRKGIHLRGFAQKQPKQEYKREAFEMFRILLDTVSAEVSRIIMRVQIQDPAQIQQAAEQLEEQGEATQRQIEERAHLQAQKELAQSLPRAGRNDPCPCGSGQKYKNCHGKLV